MPPPRPAGRLECHPRLQSLQAASRHEQTTWIVVDEASERRQLARRSMLGHKPDIHEPDVWRNIGENLSRQPEKASALAMLRPVEDMPRQSHRLGQGAARV